MVARILMVVLIISGILGGILFVAASRVDWPEAWWLTGLYALFLFDFMAWGAIHAPDLMRERGRMAGNVKRWDKLINLISVMDFIGLLVVAGLDARHRWSDVGMSIKVTGGLGIVIAGIIVLWTIRANAFLSRWARIQDDRGHKVVTGGPYRFVRHPMYAAIIFFILCTPLELGSWWAFLPAGLTAAVYVVRTKREDQMLKDELEGYCDYAGNLVGGHNESIDREISTA